MNRISSIVIGAGFCGLLGIAATQPASAQSREVPAGDSLAQTPPIDQRAKQYRALPPDQKPVVDGEVLTRPPVVPGAVEASPR